MAARHTTNDVKDYMWLSRDSQSQWGPGWKTNRQVWEDVTTERGASTSANAIRRSLKWLIAQGVVENNSAADPEIFRWSPGKPFPGTPPDNDKHRKPAPETTPQAPQQKETKKPVDTAQAAQPRTTPAQPAQPRTPQEQLHEQLQARIAEASGKKKAAPKEAKENEKAPRKGIIRQNGQLYLPRSLAGRNISDVEALRKLRDAGLYPLLYGPPGTGKSVLPEATFGNDLVIFEGNEDSGVDDLIGGYTQTENGWVWVDGPALIAAKGGLPLFLDDMTLVAPKVLAALYPLMDGRKEIWVPQHTVKQPEIDSGSVQPHNTAGRAEHVKAASGFWVAGAHNPGVHGAILTDALRSRFTVAIEIETDLDLVGQLKVPEKFVRLTRNLRTKKHNNDIQWVPQLRELLAAKATSEAFDEVVAAANLAGVAPDEDREIVLDMIRSIWGSDIKPLNLQGQI